MKKILAFILAMGLIAACCGTSIADEASEAQESEALIKTVAYIPLLTATDFHLQLAEAIVGALNDAGYEAEYTSPDGDITKQIEILENYVAKDYDCIIIFPLDGDALSDAVQRAMDAGVKVIVMVNATANYDAAILSDPAGMGDMLCEMASDWVDEAFADAGDGEVKCALVQYYSDNNTTKYSDAMAEIESYNPKIKVVTTIEEPNEELATGQSMAENLVAQYPDINLFMITSGTVALGFNAYYTSMGAEGTDLSKIGAFSINGNNDTYQAIADSAENTSMYRGVVIAATIQESANNLVSYVNVLNEGSTDFPALTLGTKVDATNAASFIAE